MPLQVFNSSSTTASTGEWAINGSAEYGNDYVKVYVEQEEGKLSPIIYFKYLKSKLKFLEDFKLKARIKRLEKAFNKAVENGQEALGEKFLAEISRETKESILWAKGYKMFVESEEVQKYKHKIKGGHISDTKYEDYTRVIPDDIVKKKKAAEAFFDNFIILHYWNEKAKDVKKMDPDEKAKMRDPILFGKIKETNRWYYIADWEDEKCDLTFDKLIDYLGKDNEEVVLSANPVLVKE